MLKLDDKVAIVTGAGKGIGRAIALVLAKEGADVAVNDINFEEAQEVQQEVEALGTRAIAVQADVANSEQVNRMFETVMKEFGKVDILVNNAGGHGGIGEKKTLFHNSEERAWDHVIAVNLKGTRNCCRAVINHMIEKRAGKIVNIGSTSGVRGNPAGVADYCAAKAGVIGFTKALCWEVGEYGINVNCVSPGPIETPAIAGLSQEVRDQYLARVILKRWGKPEEIANMVVFLVSDDANFITGQNYIVCGGACLIS